MNTIFLVVPPGFETLAVNELNEKVPGLEILAAEKGGLLLSSPLELALTFHAVLKIPTAVRLRIAEFKCRDFPRLYNKIQSIRWNQYLISNSYQLSVQCSKSRLLNEKRVEETVREGIARFFEKQPPKKARGEPFAFEIHVRFFDDVGTISLDLSGEPLFKRGYKSLTGVAPIRENLAAGLFYALWSNAREKFDTLIDPLCGSGTLLFEAQTFFQNVTARKFAYENRSDWLPTPLKLEGGGPQYFYGFDRDEKILQTAHESLASIAQAAKVTTSNWVFSKRDLFAKEPFLIKGQARAIICNPPYGERITFSKKPELYYQDMRDAFAVFEPALVGVIVPQKLVKLWPEKFSGLTKIQALPFENGGIEVVFLIYRR